MKLRSLVTGAAILALSASAALAATPTHNPRHHNNRLARSMAANEPAQPIAYSKLDAYLKASPAQQKNGNWGLDTSTAAAASGAGANASAMAPSGSSTATTGAAPAAEPAPSASAPSTTSSGSEATPPASTPNANQPATPPPDNSGGQSNTPK